MALLRELDTLTGKMLQLETQKRSGYEEYVQGKLPKEKFMELGRTAESKAEALRLEKERCEQKLAAIQKELPDEEKHGAQGADQLTAETLQKYVKRIEVAPNKQACMELLEGW